MCLALFKHEFLIYLFCIIAVFEFFVEAEYNNEYNKFKNIKRFKTGQEQTSL